MFNYLKNKNKILSVIYSCETTTQWLNLCKWLKNLYNCKQISLSQYNNLMIISLDYGKNVIQDNEEYLRRLNNVKK